MAVAEAPQTTITDEDLMRLPKDGRKWELVDGKLKEVPTSVKHNQIVIWLGRLMGPYADVSLFKVSALPRWFHRVTP